MSRLSSPYINRFLSADTIVPGAGNPQALNRYSYVLNNPLKYIDPTGHDAISTCGGNTSCMSYVTQHPENIDTTSNILKTHKEDKKDWNDIPQAEQESLLGVGIGPGYYVDYVSGNASKANALHDPLTYLEIAVVGWGSYNALVNLATINSEAGILSIGSMDLYEKAGYTFFRLPDTMYKILNTVGLGRLINISVVANQIAQEKPAIVSLVNPLKPGPGTEMEIGMLKAAQYIQGTANWLGANNIWQPSTWQWIK